MKVREVMEKNNAPQQYRKLARQTMAEGPRLTRSKRPPHSNATVCGTNGNMMRVYAVTTHLPQHRYMKT